ncbi:MAG: sulfite exporter TauE/SafE family protein [Phycisphaerales bacterium]
MIYAVLGALVVGLSLGIFGSGGSILTVPVLIYLLHHPDKAAIAESLAIVGAIAACSAIPYAIKKHVDWRTAIVFGLPGMAGTYAGAWIAAYVPGYVQLFVFAGVMLLAALQMWKRSAPRPNGADTGQTEHHAAPKPRSVLKIAVEGLGVGVLTGFVGVGGGFLIVPALVLLGGLSMRRAVATSLVIIALKSGAGFVKYLDVLDRSGYDVDWNVTLIFILFGAMGSFAGGYVSSRIDQRLLKRGFSIFLVLMATFILTKEGTALITHDSPDGPPPIQQTEGPTP